MKARMGAKTEWFPQNVRPVHVGWYELYRWRNDCGGCGRAWWNGEAWHYDDWRPFTCVADRWRGVRK